MRAGEQTPTARKEADAEADRAMAWLQKAVAAGYKNAANMKNDKDLDDLPPTRRLQEAAGRFGDESQTSGQVMDHASGRLVLTLRISSSAICSLRSLPSSHFATRRPSRFPSPCMHPSLSRPDSR